MNRKSIIFVSLILIGMLSLASGQQTREKRIDVITIDNYIINPIISKFIVDTIKQAEEKQSICVIIQLDTPGGLLESTRDIVKAILNSHVPIVTYISPSGSRAGSAGVFITLASHVAVMAPSTNIGSAHPVSIGIIPSVAKQEKDEKVKDQRQIMNEKIMNDTIAWVTTIAKTRNRNVEWAKKAVKESISSTEKEALKAKVIDFIASDLDEVIDKLDNMKVATKYDTVTLHTKDASIDYAELTPQQKILNTIAHPNIAYILMLLGVIGLIFEFSHPGIGFPGIAGFICLLLAFYSFQAIPINYTGLALIILGIILLIAEAFTPTFGILTLGGFIALTIGSMMLVKSPYEFLRVSVKIIIPFAITTASIILFLVINAVKTHRRKVTTGKEGLIGKTASAVTNISPKGKVFLHGEIWNAYCQKGQSIKKKEPVKVIGVEGLKLKVEKVK